MNAREQARAQALEEIGDNVANLLQIHRYCSGWKVQDEYPGPGCMRFWKEFDFDGDGGGCVFATIEVNYQGAMKIEVRDIS